jgi:flagellar hook-length control protein FliK
METNRIDLAFALASKSNQTKSASTGNNGAFADMLLGALGQKANTVGTEKAQVKPAETYSLRRRFDDYAPNQFDMRNNADTHTDRRVENTQSRSRWSVSDTSTNPGNGPQTPVEQAARHARTAKGSHCAEAQPGEAAEVVSDGTVDPASEIDTPEGEQDIAVGGDDCGKQDADSDAQDPATPSIAVAAPVALPEELPAAGDLDVTAASATAAAAATSNTASTDDASPEELAAAAAVAATSALPEAAATAEGAEDLNTSTDTDKTDKTAGDAAKRGVTFSATLALTDTGDDAAAEAENQINAIKTRNEQQIEDAGNTFRRNTPNARRNQGNGTGTAGTPANTAHQAGATAAAGAATAEAHASGSATQSTTALASGVVPIGFDTGLGNATGLPGWNLHLAQGNAIRRGDFVANLRQHLQNLPVHDQVALSIQRSLRDGGGSITLQLTPSELGRIHLKLKIDEENNVQASVVVERPATLELLQRDMKALERALQEAGLKAGPGDLSFSLQGGDPESFAREFGSGNGNGSNGAGNANGADSAEDVPAAVAAPVVDTADGWVDVQV